MRCESISRQHCRRTCCPTDSTRRSRRVPAEQQRQSRPDRAAALSSRRRDYDPRLMLPTEALGMTLLMTRFARADIGRDRPRVLAAPAVTDPGRFESLILPAPEADWHGPPGMVVYDCYVRDRGSHGCRRCFGICGSR